MTNFLKQAGKSAKDVAKQVAKQVAREPVEILKSASPATTAARRQEEKGMSVMQEVMTGDGKVKDVTPAERAQEETKTKNRLEELEQELRKLRQQRLEEQKAYTQSVAEEMGQVEGPEAVKKQPEPLVEPASRPKRGMMAPGKKKQGTREMGKQLSG